MKKKFFGLVIFSFLYLTSCENGDNPGQFDDAIIENESNQYKFKQINFTLSIINSSNEFLVNTQIDSIKIKVNGKEWGTFMSESIDTTNVANIMKNDIMFSNNKISYLVIAPYILKTDKLETAGDYVEYLYNRIILTPGDYVCEISEIKFRNLKGQWISFKPNIYQDFKVIENTSSSYIGHL
jgi:hypothetical protein